MKPVGLIDPRTGGQPHAVVQLRREWTEGTLYNIVGFQTKLAWPEQLPDLPDDPRSGKRGIRPLWERPPEHLSERPDAADGKPAAPVALRLFFAGQITGVEGYVESTAMGLLAGLNASRYLSGREMILPPRETAFGRARRSHQQRRPETFSTDERTFGLSPAATRPHPEEREGSLLRPARACRAVVLAGAPTKVTPVRPE